MRVGLLDGGGATLLVSWGGATYGPRLATAVWGVFCEGNGMDPTFRRPGGRFCCPLWIPTSEKPQRDRASLNAA